MMGSKPIHNRRFSKHFINTIFKSLMKNIKNCYIAILTIIVVRDPIQRVLGCLLLKILFLCLKL